MMQRRFLFIAVLLLGAMTGMAQQKYNRGDFSFKTTKMKNAEGELSHVKIEASVGHKIINTFVAELPGEPMETTIDAVGNIEEPDLNFDGYPDVTIYLGYYGSHPNDVYYEALLWDQASHRFVQAEGYDGLPEPMVDEQTHLIATSLRDGPDHRVTDYYGWQGNKIIQLRSERWAIEDAETCDFSGLRHFQCYRFNAKLDGRISVILAFQRLDDLVAGYIYYPKAKTPAPIMVIGHVQTYQGTEYYSLSEYQPDGIVTGLISLQYKQGVWSEMDWTNPKTEKVMRMTDAYFSREMPEWFTTTLLAPEDPGNIGREYSFQQWRSGYDSYMGGHISFRAAGKNKVHFECRNVVRNIAEGWSDEGRPAVLHGNVFEYRDVNECGYGFKATFYPKFVELKSITDGETLDCFGAFSAFDGIYIKVKQ